MTHARPGLDQPAGDQELVVPHRGAVAEVLRRAEAVAVAEPRVLARDVEGLGELARGEHVERPAVERCPCRRSRRCRLRGGSGRTRRAAAGGRRTGRRVTAVCFIRREVVAVHPGGAVGAAEDARRRACCRACAASPGRGRRTAARPGRPAPAPWRRPSRSAASPRAGRCPCGKPVMFWKLECSSRRPTIERSTASLSIACRRAAAGARRSGCPARLVAIGLNSPRISAGASGLRSNVSWWARPPER